MHALKVYQVYNPVVTNIYSIILDISGVLGLVFYPLMIYIMLTKSSPRMRMYKWQLIYYITWSYSYNFFFAIWKPVFLFPLNIAYSTGKIYLRQRNVFLP